MIEQLTSRVPRIRNAKLLRDFTVAGTANIILVSGGASLSSPGRADGGSF